MFNSMVAPGIVAFFILCFCCAIAERTVSLTCTSDLMQLTMTFESKFNGRITVLPHRECEIRGEGKRLILFPIAFQSSVADQCFLNKLNSDYVGLLEIRNHKTLVLANDVSYLVRCPVHVMPPPSVHPAFDGPPIRAQLFIHPKNEPLDLEVAGIPLEMVVGKAYRITIPVNEGVENQVRIGQCIIFPVGEYERIIELTNTNGCVKNINFAKDFHWVRGEFGWALQTEFEMFSVGLENFAIQCELKRCFGACDPVRCGVETSTQNIDQRSVWLVSAPCRLDQRAISAPSIQRCAEGQCSSGHQFYIIAIILVILCAITTAAWLIACWNRPKVKYIKSWIKGVSKPERFSNSYASSRNCPTLPVPTTLNRSIRKHTPLVKTLTESVDHSLDAPNLDDLLRERAETKKRLDMDDASASSLKRPEPAMPTYSIFKSIDSNVIQFPSLDDLPEPPHITVGEIQELNKALNAPRLLEPRPLKRTTTANSVNSIGTTRTIDPVERRASIASTVDFRPPVFLKNLLNLPKPTSKLSFSPDPLKLFSRLSTASSSSSLDITSTGDQKLYSILQDLRKSTAEKEAEIAKTAAENDTKWLKLLSNN